MSLVSHFALDETEPALNPCRRWRAVVVWMQSDFCSFEVAVLVYLQREIGFQLKSRGAVSASVRFVRRPNAKAIFLSCVYHPYISLLSENTSDCVCFRSCIFYRACVDIPRGTELLVWYNDSYTSFFGIPLQCIAQDENCKTPLLLDASGVHVAVNAACVRRTALRSLGLRGEVDFGAVSVMCELVSFLLVLRSLLCFFSLFLPRVLLPLSLIYFCLHHLQFSALSLCLTFFPILSGFPCFLTESFEEEAKTNFECFVLYKNFKAKVQNTKKGF